jgi:hypothetical protein
MQTNNLYLNDCNRSNFINLYIYGVQVHLISIYQTLYIYMHESGRTYLSTNISKFIIYDLFKCLVVIIILRNILIGPMLIVVLRDSRLYFCQHCCFPLVEWNNLIKFETKLKYVKYHYYEKRARSPSFTLFISPTQNLCCLVF